MADLPTSHRDPPQRRDRPPVEGSARQAMIDAQLQHPTGSRRKLDFDERELEKTLGLIEGLGQINATEGEVASVLNVAPSTLRNFWKRHPEAREIYDDAMNRGRVKLRRAQFEMATQGHAATKTPPNVQIQKWLGEQMLGQRAHAPEQQAQDDAGVRAINIKNLTLTQLKQLAERVRTELVPSGGDAPAEAAPAVAAPDPERTT